MFRINDNVFTPNVDWMRAAVGNLPQVEQRAREAAIEHIRSHVHGAATEAGLPIEGIGVGWKDGQTQLSIPEGPVADHEYGTLTTSPSSLLRNTARREHPTAEKLYQAELRRGVGF